MVVNKGNTRSNASRLPPANIAMLPVAALWHPPDTGLSKASAPFASTSSPNLFTSSASEELISSQIFPSLSPAITPSSASRTSAETLGDGRQVITTSQLSATAFGLSADFAPSSTRRLVASGSGSKTVTSNPFRSKLPESFAPTLPSPMKPTFMLKTFSFR